MQKIILQPCWNEATKKNYEHTIINWVSLEEIEKYLDTKEVTDLKTIYGDKKIEVRWVTPWENNINVWKYNKTSIDDLVMFSSSWNIMYIWSICYKIHNESLASNLRWQDENGKTWEYIYFLIDGKEESIPLLDIYKLVWYKERFIVRTITVVDEEKSAEVLAKYGNIENALSSVDAEYSKPTIKDIDYIKTKSKKIKTPEEAIKLINVISKEIENKPPREKQRIIRAIVRDPKLSKLIKERVSYICQTCGQSPFKMENWWLYAEAHHLKELGGGGLDHPNNMICVCPNCHMKIHHATKDVVESLLSKIR